MVLISFLGLSSVIATSPIAPAAGADELALQASPSPASTLKGQVARKDAPVDGKDGRPHEGPWVETEAERSRKEGNMDRKDDSDKSKSNSQGPKPKYPEANDGVTDDLDTAGPNPKLPKSNDGVMDDRNRAGPKEGTRGTEGGISEKSREKQDNMDLEKKPEPPKEVPSLPHSEEQKISLVEEAKAEPTGDSDSKGLQSSDDEDDLEGEVGGLKVSDGEGLDDQANTF